MTGLPLARELFPAEDDFMMQPTADEFAEFIRLPVNARNDAINRAARVAQLDEEAAQRAYRALAQRPPGASQAFADMEMRAAVQSRALFYRLRDAVN